MDNVAFWDKIAPKYAKSKIGDPEGYEATLARTITHLSKDMNVLEMGCGTGSTALQLAPHVTRFRGTDVSPGMISIAENKKAANPVAGLSFSVAAAGLQPDGPYDAVLALNLLHLLPDLEQHLSQIAEDLSPGALFISKTPLLQDGPFYLGTMIRVMQAFGKAPYVRRLNAEELISMMHNVGFDVIETVLQSGIAPRLYLVARKL